MFNNSIWERLNLDNCQTAYNKTQLFLDILGGFFGSTWRENKNKLDIIIHKGDYLWCTAQASLAKMWSKITKLAKIVLRCLPPQTLPQKFFCKLQICPPQISPSPHQESDLLMESIDILYGLQIWLPQPHPPTIRPSNGKCERFWEILCGLQIWLLLITCTTSPRIRPSRRELCRTTAGNRLVQFGVLFPKF